MKFWALINFFLGLGYCAYTFAWCSGNLPDEIDEFNASAFDYAVDPLYTTINALFCSYMFLFFVAVFFYYRQPQIIRDKNILDDI